MIKRNNLKLNRVLNTKTILVLSFFFVFVFVLNIAYASVPLLINYKSRLLNSDGTPVTNPVSIQFSLYTNTTSGSPTDTASATGTLLWKENYDGSTSACSEITPDANGYLYANLGSCTSFPSYLDFNSSSLYLGVKIGGDTETSPRVQFVSVPFALNSERVNGLEASSEAAINKLLSLDSNLNFNIATGTFVGNGIRLSSLAGNANQCLTSDINGNIVAGSTNSCAYTTTNSISVSNRNIITSVVNGVTSTANIIDSSYVSSQGNSFQTTINGILSNVSNIINSFTQAVTGNVLSTTVNGVTATTSVITGNSIDFSNGVVTTNINGVIATTSITGLLLTTTNDLSSSINTLTSVVNGVSSSTSIINSNNLLSTVNTLTSNINGVTSTSSIINSSNLSINGSTLTVTINGVATSTDLTLLVASSTTNNLSIATSTNDFTITSNVNGATSSVTNTIINSNLVATTTNTFQNILNGIASNVVDIINSFTQSLSGNILTTTINGVTSTSSVISNNDITSSSSNELTSNVNGVISTTTIVNTNVASSSENLFQTIVNGIASNLSNIINSFTQSLSGNTLTTTINGVTATSTVISSNNLSVSGTNLTSSVNGVSTSTDLSSLVASSTTNNIDYASGVITSNVNGVVSTTSIIGILPTTTNVLSSAINTLTSIVNGVTSTASIINSNVASTSGNFLETIVNGVSSGITNIISSNILSVSTTTNTNTITSNINGVSTSTTLTTINSNSLATTTNTLQTIVNGVSSAVTNIINSFNQNLSGNTLTTTINGVSATSSVISSNNLSSSANTLTSDVNGVTSTAGIISSNSLNYSTSTSLLSSIINGVTSTTQIIASQWVTNGTSIYYNDGNVGIGTTTPAGSLDVTKTTGTQEVFFGTGGANSVYTHLKSLNQDWILWNAGSIDNSFRIHDGTAGQTRLTIDTNGNVGIGTTNPVYKLDVNGTGNFASSVTASSFIKSGGTSSQFLKADGSIDSTTYLSAGAYLPLSGGTLTGNLSISKSHPTLILNRGSSAEETDINLQTAGSNNWLIGQGTATGSGNDYEIYSYGNGVKQFSLNYTTGAASFYGSITSSNIPAGTVGNNFLVSNGGTISYRTPAQTLTDIGGLSSSGNTTISSQTYLASTTIKFGNAGYVGLSSSIFTGGSATDLGLNSISGNIWFGQGLNPKMFFDGTNGRLGINTSAPSYLLDVAGGDINTSGVYRLSATQFAGLSGSTITLGNTGSNSLSLYAGAADRLYIRSDLGYVGIGTNSPGYQLHVSGAGQDSTAIADAGNQGGTIMVASTNNSYGSGGALLFSGRNDSGTYYPQAAIKSFLTNGVSNGIGDLAFSTRNSTSDTSLTERMRITSGGNVGIGTASPGAQLQIGAYFTNLGGRLLTSNGSGWAGDGATPKFVISDTTTNTNKGALIGIDLHNDSTTINTYSPMIAFSRRSNSTSYNSTFAAILGQATGQGADTNWVAGDLIFANTPVGGYMTESMRINSAGNVGVGTASPGYKLDVNGQMRAERYNGVNSLILNSYTTANPSSNVYLYSQPNDRDSWIYLDSADTSSNWGIYHRQIDSAVSGLPGNSIGFIGGGSSTLQAYISLLNGNAYFNGNVGIGTASPDTALRITTPYSGWQLHGSNGVEYYLGHSAGYGMHINTGNTSDSIYAMELYDGSADLMSVYNSGRIYMKGNVGIGTASPGYKLDVNGIANVSTAVNTPALSYANSPLGGLYGAYPNTNSNSRSFIYSINASYANVAGHFGISYDQGYNRICIDGNGSCNVALSMDGQASYFNAGNVGIGTTNPAYKLTVTDNYGSWLSVNTNNYNGAEFDYAHGGGYGAYINAGSNSSSGTYALYVRGAGNDIIYARGDGYVGIGTTSPGYKLDVNGTLRTASDATLQNVYTDTINSMTAGDPLEINYRSTSPTKICGTASCGITTAYFDTAGNTTFYGNIYDKNNQSIVQAPFQSDHDFPTGALIQTNIYVGNGEPWTAEITAFNYSSGRPTKITINAYNYGGSVYYAGGAIGEGMPITGITVFNYGGYLGMYIPTQGYWHAYNVNWYVNYGGNSSNRVTSITNTAKPSVTSESAVNPVYALDTANYNSYVPTLTGGGASGTWGINITGNASTLTQGSYFVNPNGNSYLASFQVGGGSLLANWPGYPAGIQQTDGNYFYPGFLSGQGSGWNTSYYLAGSTSWGLYSNTSFNAAGGLYDAGSRVCSASISTCSVNVTSLGGYGASNYLGKNGTPYYQPDTWINFNSTNAGLYWNGSNVGYGGSNYAEIYPNTTTTYGIMNLEGYRNGYSGFRLVNAADTVLGMYDTSGNGGDWDPSTGWHFYWNRSNNSLGIGGSTTNASYRMYVNGAAYVSGGLDVGSTVSGQNFHSTGYSPGGTYHFYGTRYGGSQVITALGENGTGGGYLALYNASNALTVFINSDSNSADIAGCSYGSAYAGGSSCASDINLKKNITTLENGSQFNLTTIDTSNMSILDKLNSLVGVEYNFKTEEDTVPKHTGFIAQNVQEIFPDLVSTDPIKGNLMVSYAGFSPYIVTALQELNRKILDTNSTSSALLFSNVGSTTLINNTLQNAFNNLSLFLASTTDESIASTTLANLNDLFSTSSLASIKALTNTLTRTSFDLDLNGNALVNVKSIEGASKNWKIGDDGIIYSKEIRADKYCNSDGSTCIDISQIPGALISNTGSTGGSTTSTDSSTNTSSSTVTTSTDTTTSTSTDTTTATSTDTTVASAPTDTTTSSTDTTASSTPTTTDTTTTTASTPTDTTTTTTSSTDTTTTTTSSTDTTTTASTGADTTTTTTS